jgi:hypothetical protein
MPQFEAAQKPGCAAVPTSVVWNTCSNLINVALQVVAIILTMDIT